MSVKESINQLRKRVFILRGLKTTPDVAREIGIDGVTLREWLRGTRNVTMGTLAAIEDWCDDKDAAQEEHTHVSSR
mgnify:CR=1 FL=1